jgi:oligosaccharide repeat unit polymerase
MAFYLLAGSRTLVLLPALFVLLPRHYLYRRLSTARLAAITLAAVVGLSTFLAVRTETGFNGASFAQAARTQAIKGLDPRTFLNDNNHFDNLLMATDVFDRTAPIRNSLSLVDAVRLYIPVGTRGDAEDVAFRQLIWGEQLGAGRPYTVIGGFYADFGWPGIVVGSILLGVLMRAIASLVRSGPLVPGHAFRIAMMSVAMVLLYNLVTTTYSVTVGLAVQAVLPLLGGLLFLVRRKA